MTDRRPSMLDLMRYADGEADPERIDEIERYLREHPESQAIVRTFDEISHQVQSVALDRAQPADSIVDDVMKLVEEHDRGPTTSSIRQVQRRAPAVASKRTPQFAYALAGLALAAAAALVIWNLSGDRLQSLAHTPSAPSNHSLPAPSVEMAVAPPATEVDSEPGVQVDAIEFGAHAGTIFYVPTETGTTTVVWLSDDEPGESP